MHPINEAIIIINLFQGTKIKMYPNLEEIAVGEESSSHADNQNK